MNQRDRSPDPIVVPSLDTPLGPFLLTSSGRLYTVTVTRFHRQPLYENVLEWSFMEPEEFPEVLTEFHEEELEAIERLGMLLGLTWSDWDPSPVLTPPPDWRDPEFQRPARWQGSLCAATLVSWDKGFPFPHRDEDGTEEPADYSVADIIYAPWRDEGPLPERIRAQIDWEQLARPGVV